MMQIVLYIVLFSLGVLVGYKANDNVPVGEDSSKGNADEPNSNPVEK